MICARLIFRTPELPAPLSQLSPWLDDLVVPRDEVFAQLAAQEHRRFVKTHTPLHEMTIAPRATYIVVARHPLEPRVPGEPVAYRGRLCVARLSQTRCTSSPGGDGLVDCRQELLELHGPVLAVQFRDHRAVGDVGRRRPACTRLPARRPA